MLRNDAFDASETKPAKDATLSPLFNQSLAKGLLVLSMFSANRRAMTLREMADAAGISKSAAQRGAYTLETLGYIGREKNSQRYILSPKILELGCGYLRTNTLVELANPYLQQLSSQSGETVNFGEPFEHKVIFTARFPSPRHIMAHMPLGTALPMYCSASGRAILSTYPTEDVLRILKSDIIVAHTHNTTTDIDLLQQKIAESREQGFAYTIEEYYQGDFSLAAAVTGRDGRAIAAVNISVPASRWTLESVINNIVPILKETAFAVSAFNR